MKGCQEGHARCRVSDSRQADNERTVLARLRFFSMSALKLFLCVCMAIGGTLRSVADNPPAALFSINGKSVTVDDFSRYYRQVQPSGEEPVRHCLDRYVDFRLKVEAALSERIDTLTQFRQQCAVLQGEVWKDYLLDPVRMEQACGQMYRKRAERLLSDTWVCLTCLTLPLHQHASKQEERQAEERMKQLYGALAGGEPLAQLMPARLEGITVQEQVWRPMRGMLKEFATRLEQLKDGEVSEPFFSPMGIHVMQVSGRREGISAETAYQFWSEQWNASGDRHPALDSLRFRQWKEGKSADPQLCRRLDDVRDGLLATYWELRHTGGATVVPNVDERQLAAYFDRHRSDYRWELPHYKGAVIHCADKKAASKIRKRLKKLQVQEWADELRVIQAERPEWQTEMICGLFRIGQNAYIDKLAFRCGDLPVPSSAAYTFVMGKRLNAGPEDYRDVLPLLRNDYCQWYESTRLQRLKDQFRVEIHEDVLKTVNCRGEE